MKAKRKPKKKGPFWGAKLHCFTCNETIQSSHVHHMATCSCWRKGKGIMIDGGGEYCRMSANPNAKYEIIDPGNYAFPNE